MISIAVCDDNEITAQEISEKVKQCCPIEAEVSVFYHITYLLYFKERYRYLSFNRIKKGHTADSKDKSVLFDYPIKAAAYSYCTK